MLARRVIVALILWIGGVEVLPNLHLALHDHLAAHHHVGDATIFDHTHEHTPKKHRGPNDRSIQLAHGADSLAHHAMALHTPPFVHLCPLPIDRRPLLRPAIPIIEPESRFGARAKARGPPADLLG